MKIRLTVKKEVETEEGKTGIVEAFAVFDGDSGLVQESVEAIKKMPNVKVD